MQTCTQNRYMCTKISGHKYWICRILNRVSHKYCSSGQSTALPSNWKSTWCGRWRNNQQQVGNRSISANVNKPASTIALHIPGTLSIMWAWVLIPLGKPQLSIFFMSSLGTKKLFKIILILQQPKNTCQCLVMLLECFNS